MVLVENYAAHSQNWLHCFDSADMSDVVVGGKDGRTFHCHKLVLAVASPFFKRLFFGGEGNCSQKFVSQTEVDPAGLKWILKACYTGDGDLDDTNVISVMVAAKLFEIGWVEEACMEYLKGELGKPLATFEYSKENERWQEWVVPESGWYHIVAVGAKAADAPPDPQNYISKGGEGAMLGGSFELKAKEVVQMLTGGMSRMWQDTKHPNYFTGGGGGTFVAKKKNLSLLLAAGGGGSINVKSSGTDASMKEDGIGADRSCVGGKAGGNGTNNGTHLGGLGWKAGPVALATPSGGHPNRNGGFGGGGALCGGGAGYSGGSAGANNNGAGGGGSYIAPEAKNSWKKLGNLSHGKVYIWKGEMVPNEMFFWKHFGDISAGSQANGESFHSWEILD